MKYKLLITAMLMAFGVAHAENAPSASTSISINNDHSGGDQKSHEAHNIAQVEYMKHATERFERKDANHDGVLSHEERKSGRDGMREKMGKRKYSQIEGHQPEKKRN